MNTVLRVKRKANDLPLASLMIECKRKKESHVEEVKKIAQFAGTVLDTKDSHKVEAKNLHFNLTALNFPSQSVKRIFDEENQNLAKKGKWIDVSSALEDIEVNKYRNALESKINPKVLRSKNESEDESENESKNEASQKASEKDNAEDNAEDNAKKAEDTEEMLTFIDLKDNWSNILLNKRERKAKNKDSEEEEEEDYVYDLYYTDMTDDVTFDYAKIYVQMPGNMEVYSDTEDDGDTSDSNAESNWRNDYPDTEESDSESSDSSNTDQGLSSSSDDSVLYTDEENHAFRINRRVKALRISQSSSSGGGSPGQESDYDDNPAINYQCPHVLNYDTSSDTSDTDDMESDSE